MANNNKDQEVIIEPKKYIAFLGCNRFTTVVETFTALLKCRGIHDYHLLVFLDRPKNDEGIEDFKSIQNFFQSNKNIEVFKTFTMQVADKNFGVWASKLSIFLQSFNLGSDFTILLEDDVLLMPDALSFCSEACDYVLKADELMTVSLYSNNLLALENVTHSKAIKFVSENPSIFHQWGIRKWPFPWGIGLSRKAYNSFISMGWNGNDQNMGQILQDANGYDLFPIISRADHIGKSVSENGQFKVIKHVPFEDFHYLKDKFRISKDAPIDVAINNANHFYTQLKNDLSLSESRVKILFCDPIFQIDIANFKENNIMLDVDATYIDPLWYNDVDTIKIYDVIARISAPVTVLLFNKNRVKEFIISELKNKATRVLIGLDKDEVFDVLKTIT